MKLLFAWSNRAILVILLLVANISHAAGYLEFDDNGTPYKWDNSVTYVVDTSDLGTIMKGNQITPGTADYLVRQAFDAWENVNPTPAFVGGADASGPNSGDIKLSNFSSYVNLNGTSCPTPDFVVVYDDDGTIFANLFGSSSSSILGLSTPSVLNKVTHKVTCGYALLNGDAVGDLDTLEYTLMHEFGHGRNLEHTQINADLYLDGGNLNDQYIPLMFPVIPQNLTGLGGALLGGMGGIKLDDQFSLLYLYNDSVLNNEGRIRGKVRGISGDGVLGANVVCYDKDHPDENVVSWVSDSVLDGQGEYECGHLPDGDYQVRIEPVTIAINQWTQGTPPFIPTEFFNGANESSDASIDALSEKTDVTISSSDTVDNINLFVNDNGRITSTQTITGTAAATDVADLEYFAYVPESVSKVTFELKTNSSQDLDLYGKCDSPFSLATSTAGSFYDPSDPTAQAIFGGAGASGNEEVTLDGSSSPKKDNCEYHLLVVNYGSAAANFQLTVTMEGNKPNLRANFDPKNERQSNGETLVSLVTMQAEDDQFTVESIKFTDTGIKSVSNVSNVALYEDTNNNGRVDAADDLLDTTTISGARTFTLNNLNLFIKEGQQKQILVTYQIPSSASSLPLMILLIGVFAVAIFSKNKKIGFTTAILFACVMLNRCSGSDTHDYNPTIEQPTEIKAKASGFGDEYSVQVGKPQSVKEFFE